MKRQIAWVLVGAAFVLAACVTINVYFPEAAAERAADRFIQDVIGEEALPDEVPPPSSGMNWSDLFVARAYAQDPNIDIDTPQVDAIKERMAERHRDYLAEWYGAGAIGLTRDGLVEVRDRSAVGLSDRRNLERVVAEENADRNAVYREISVANGHPEWEDDVRQTFARRWIANARAGWYYQTDDGRWIQK